MAEKGVADDVKDESGIIDNMAIAEPHLCFADASNTKNIKNGYFGFAEDKFLRLNPCHCNITAIDNQLKNMHKQWSMID